MYTFSLFLEARIDRNAIPMDQDDIRYLKQFPQHFWIDAIKQRYNDLLLQAISGKTNDPVAVTVRTSRPGIQGGRQQFRVNARMDKLLYKLKSLGFDLSDPHPETQTLSNMKLMNKDQARMLIKNWINYSQQQGAKGLAPGFARFTPTKLERGINSYDNQQDSEYRSKWAQLQKVVPEEAKYQTQLLINKLSNPEHPLHLNYYYWRERTDELIKGMVKRVEENLANPQIMDQTYRRKLMFDYAGSEAQKGHINRRVLEKAQGQGLNIPKLIKKGYTIAQIVGSIPSRQNPNPTPLGKPQQQPDLKSIHQSVETPGSAIANSGKRTIGALRQAHSQKVMQSPELQQQVTPYQLAPEQPVQQQQPRRAARKIDDLLSFKDWVHAKSA